MPPVLPGRVAMELARERYIGAMRDRGIDPLTSAPPLWRLLWRCGAEAPPPHFLSFATLAWCMGLPFALAMTLAAGAIWWSFETLAGLPLGHIDNAIGAAVLAGVLFGVEVARRIRRQATEAGLPSWEAFVAGAALPERAAE